MEFETLDSLVVTVVEVLCVGIDLPVFRVINSRVLLIFVVGRLSDVSVLLSFSNGSLRPCASCQIVGSWSFSIPKEVEWNCTELE